MQAEKRPAGRRHCGRAILLALAWAIVLLGGTSEQTHANSYMKPAWPLTRPEAIEEAFAYADAVILGRILESRFENVPMGEGGFTGKRTLVVSVGQVLKGNTAKNQIEVTPSVFEGSWAPIEAAREQRSFVVLFLMDVPQRMLDRREPGSGKVSRSHEWFLMQFSDDHSMAILFPESDRTLMPRLVEMKRNQSLEGATRQADVVVIGEALWPGVRCIAFGKPSYCGRVSVQQVLKGRLEPRIIGVISKGLLAYPDPAAPAVYFLRRQNATTFEILHFSAGARPIRGNRLRELGLSLDEAMARIKAVSAQ